jgi:hypothetical protein
LAGYIEVAKYGWPFGRPLDHDFLVGLPYLALEGIIAPYWTCSNNMRKSYGSFLMY